MSRRLGWIILVLALMAASGVLSVLGFIWVTGGTAEPSAPISAPTLALTPAADDARVAALSTQVAQLAADNAALQATLAASAGESQAAAPTPEPAATAPILFRITPDESQVRFLIDEDLRGQRVTVVGATNQVAGDILVDTAAPANSQVGVIRINVRTLVTDEENRNRALRSRILLSAEPQYEFSDFTPKAISGMPERVEVGQPVTFQITGDLTLRGVTREVTFETTAALVSPERLEGQAQATVLYRDFGLTIPAVPFVANVADEVRLEIDFVALKMEA